MSEPLNRSLLPHLSEEEARTLSFEEGEKVNHERAEEVKKQVAEDLVNQAKEARNFAEKEYQDNKEELQRYAKYTGREDRALDLMLYNRPDLLSQLNKKRPNAPIDYSAIAARHSYEAYAQYMSEMRKYDPNYQNRATSLTSDDPGVGASLDMTVSQSIMYRVDNFMPIVDAISKINLPYGDYRALEADTYAQAGYFPEGNTVPDNTANLTDATNGIDKVDFKTKPFGVRFVRSFLTEDRLSAAFINQVLEMTEQQLGRGKAYQIMSGSGSGQNDNGIINFATSITSGANALERSIDATTAIRNNNAFKNDVFFVMNPDAWGQFIQLSTNTGTNWTNYIDVQNQTIGKTPVIIAPQNVMPTNAGTAKVVVGRFTDYMELTNGATQQLTLRDTSNADKIDMFLLARDGGPVFSNSFATFDLSV